MGKSKVREKVSLTYKTIKDINREFNESQKKINAFMRSFRWYNNKVSYKAILLNQIIKKVCEENEASESYVRLVANWDSEISIINELKR